MSFFDILRNLFGGNRSDEPRSDGFFDQRSYVDSFRNPIWQNDEDEDDIDDLRHPRGGVHFRIFSDPIEIMRYFESQMDSMMKGMMEFHQNDAFHLPGDKFMGALPAPPSQGESLRDNVLKRNPEFSNPFGSNKQGEDTDLDGKITPNDLVKAWETPNWTQTLEPFTQRPTISQHTFGKSVRKEFYSRPDGTVEQRQIFRDSEGNEETVITRQIGDKKYTVSTKRDKNGVETRTEDLVNISESELKDFTQQWKPLNDKSTNEHNPPLNHFNWEEFFGFSPKL